MASTSSDTRQRVNRVFRSFLNGVQKALGYSLIATVFCAVLLLPIIFGFVVGEHSNGWVGLSVTIAGYIVSYGFICVINEFEYELSDWFERVFDVDFDFEPL